MSSKINESVPAIVSQPVKRRNWVLGAGALGAAAVAFKVLPAAGPLAPVVAVAEKSADIAGGGYRLTAHIQRYYDTAKT